MALEVKILNNKIYEMMDRYFGDQFVLYNNGYCTLDDHQLNFFALFIRYIEALGKSLGLNVDQSQRLLQRINQKNMQCMNDDLDFQMEVLNDDYTEFSDQLEIQYLSLLDIQRYSVDISSFYREDDEINQIDPPETIEELFDRLYNFPKDDKKIILDAIHQDENGGSYQSLLDDVMQDEYDDSDVSLHIYIDQNYTKYRKRYEKWFKNDHVYQTLDQSAPEYVYNLCTTSVILKNGARCDIFLDGYMIEAFSKYISTINHQYFIDQIKIRKKLNLL